MNTANPYVMVRDIPRVYPQGVVNSYLSISVPMAIEDIAVKLDALDDLYMAEMSATPERAGIIRRSIQSFVADAATRLFELSRVADTQLKTSLWGEEGKA